jgi:hypothetical protein
MTLANSRAIYLCVDKVYYKIIQKTIKKIGKYETTVLPVQNRVDKRRRNNCVDETHGMYILLTVRRICGKKKR